MTSLLFSPGLWCLIWAMSCYTYPLMTNSVSWLMYQNRTRTCEGKEKSIEMVCRLTGLCSRRRKRARSDDVACFCFHSERECGAEAGRGSMYVCRVPVRWGIFHPPPPAHLWSHPSFEVTLREGRGIKAKQKSRQVHVALELTKSAICIIYSLNCWDDGISGYLTTHPAWQMQLSKLPLHICS